ncbi:MAG: hypothetical protein QM729_09025 [Solirubrobacterales bacterium]
MALSLHDQEILRRRVYGLVDDDLLAEHRERPFGPHSPALIEVLDFLRRNPDPELPRYLVLDDGEGFGIGVRAAERGAPPTPVDEDERFATRGEAEHAVFLRRLADYGAVRGAKVADNATFAPRPLGDVDPPEPDGGGAE